MDLSVVLTPALEGGFVALNPETSTATQGETVEEALAAVDSFMVEAKFGDSSKSVVLEQMLTGKEASVIAIVDSNAVLPLVVIAPVFVQNGFVAHSAGLSFCNSEQSNSVSIPKYISLQQGTFARVACKMTFRLIPPD